MDNYTGYCHPFYCTVLPLCLMLACLPAKAGEVEVEPYYQLIVATCYTCHSADNNGAGAIPDLRGLSEPDLNKLLHAYKNDREQGTIMNRISKGLTDAEIDRISVMLGRPKH